ncbi:hypothetical protein HY030_02520 [Candidatus Gottesmanbacteria bacterium]|nr:hypothetical protein [Candidatus Gottesmanbacteria bacterium]
MKRFEYFIILLLSLVILFLSFYPIYYRYKTTPPDRTYVGTTFYTADYAGYVSTIEQGIKGRWTYVDKFTTEKLSETFLYYPYLLIGHIAGFLGIGSIWAYHLSRFLLGLIYLVSIYWLIAVIFSDRNRHSGESSEARRIQNQDSGQARMTGSMISSIKRIIAFFLVLFSSSFPSKLSSIVAETQVVNRFVIQPHFLLGNIFLILGIILFLKYLEKPEKKYVILSGLMVFLVTVFRPSHVILYLATIGIYVIVSTLASFWGGSASWRRRLQNHLRTDSGQARMTMRQYFIFFLTSLVFSLPGFFYLWYLKSNFNELPYFLYDGEGKNLFNLWDLVLLQGPMLLLAVSLFFRHSGKSGILLSFVAANVVLLFVLPKIYPLNPLRFLQTPLFAILAILATEAIFKLAKNLSLITLMFLITVTFSLPTLWLDFDHEVHLYVDAYYIWPPKEYLPALKFLESSSKPQDAVLTYKSLSNLVPMISGNTIYWGHTNETLNYNQKQIMVEKFYKGLMSDQEAQEFLKSNNIKYILVGREEKALGNFHYEFLKKDFANLELELYNSEL